MADQDYPTVRLRPNANAQKIRHGAPWVYNNELVTDRRTKALAPGSIARLEDAERNPICTVAVNNESKLIARVLDANPAATIDGAWLKAKLGMALSLRTTLFTEPFYRWVHAEGDGLPGLVIDRFGSAVAIQPNAAWADAMMDELVQSVVELCPDVEVIVKNAGGRSRALEGLDDSSKVVHGELSGPVPVQMNGATYFADLTGGQKTGLFYDQRPNQAFVQRLVSGKSVLDVFSHVGGFGLAGLAGGATSVLAVDGSQSALDLAAQGAAAMNRAEDFTAERGDAFVVMDALAADSKKFGAVICDPPAFAPSKQALGKGLRAYERVARAGATLVEDGGTLTLCSCSHAAELQKFMASCVRGIGRAGRSAQLLHTGFAGADHPLHPSVGDYGYLKALTFRILS